MKSPPHPPLSPEGGGEGRVRGKICVIKRARSSFSELSIKRLDKGDYKI